MENQVEKFRKTVQLLNQITEDSQRLWGVMSPQNMVEHVGGIMYANSKGIGMPIMLPPDKAAKAKARFFGSFLPFDKSVPIPGQDSNPPKLKYDSLAEAKAKALAASEVFLKAVSDDPDKPIAHAYFGEMPLSKWVEFHTLHMEHHLMQFGVLHRDEKIKALEKLIFKINKGITADTPAQWGKMNAHQMIEHLGVTFLFSTGKFNMPYTGTEENAKKMWEGFVSSDDPWKEVFPGINIGDRQFGLEL